MQDLSKKARGHELTTCGFKECRLFEDREKELSDQLANVSDAIAQSKQGFFVAQHVLPGTKVLMGLSETSFDYPEQGVRIGGKLGETH